MQHVAAAAAAAVAAAAVAAAAAAVVEGLRVVPRERRLFALLRVLQQSNQLRNNIHNITCKLHNSNSDNAKWRRHARAGAYM